MRSAGLGRWPARGDGQGVAGAGQGAAEAEPMWPVRVVHGERGAGAQLGWEGGESGEEQKKWAGSSVIEKLGAYVPRPGTQRSRNIRTDEHKSLCSSGI
jgi:hypothetical protein